MTWQIYALLSAFFAGLTAILAKIGVAEVPSNVATFIRTIVIVAMTGSIVAFTGGYKVFPAISGRTWAFLALSGVATGFSWLFYFAALKNGPVSRVAPIDKLSFVIAMTLGVLVLRETAKPTTVAGAAIIVIGVLITLK